MSNEAAERLRREIGVAYRIALLDEALADARREAIEDAAALVEGQDGILAEHIRELA